VRFVDQVRAGLGVLGVDEAVPHRHHPAADTISRVHDRDARTLCNQIASGRQAGQAGARHEHRDTTEVGHQWTDATPFDWRLRRGLEHETVSPSPASMSSETGPVARR
jgi:hypothetical protein